MVCPQCGARVSESAERCDLCGTAVSSIEPTVESGDDDVRTQPESEQPRPESGASEGSSRCPTCSSLNRSDAVFCDQCATPLSRVKKPDPEKLPEAAKPSPPASETPEPETDSEKSRVGTLIVGGIIVIAGLYGITVLSKSKTPEQPVASMPAQGQAAEPSAYLPEDDELAAQASSIRSAIDESTDPARQTALRSQLVELYASNGRLDLAGREQDVIAESQNTAADWTLAGNLHFDWMEQQSGTERVNAAQRAVASYVKALELDPDNLDVRTDLGVAYLNDPASPMLAIQETNAVLEEDPDHVQANFNKGVMLLQIGRQAEAIQHFEKVKSLTEPGSPPHERAISVLDQVQQTSG